MRTSLVSHLPRGERREGERCGFLSLLCAILVVIVSISLANCAGYTSASTSESGGGVGNSGGGILTPNVTTLLFGNVAVGATATQSVVITNTGTGAVSISAASITGGVFTVIGGNPSSSLAIGQSASVEVQFAPTVAGAANGMLTVTSNATNSTLSIPLTGGGGQAIASFNPPSVNFNNVPVGQTSTQNVTLSNTGNANLVITSVATPGAVIGVTMQAPPVTIPPNGAISFIVSFSPNSTSGISGSIKFVDNAPDSPQFFVVTGSAVGAGSTLSANPGSFNFGNVQVGSTGTQPITISNSGTSPITISGVTSGGAGFSETGLAANQTIAAGGSATMTAQFAPTSAGTAAGTITITSNATNSPLVVSLSGTGIQGLLSANPSSINFGSLITGNTSTVNVTLTDTGTANVSISGASASGTSFRMSTLAAQTLTPGGTATFTVTFAPTSNGSWTGNVSISSNAQGSPLVIPLSGTSVATQAQISVNPFPVTFSSGVNVGGNATQSVTLANNGNATLNITSATISTGAFTMNLAPTAISAGSNTPFTVTFTPTVAGSATGTITIVSNAPTSPTTIQLSGTGLQAQGAATPSTIAFGSVGIGNTDSQTVTLKNNGNTTLTISQIVVTGSGFGQTGLSTNTTLAAGASTTFSATFDPSTATGSSGAITITTNGSPSSVVINLSGTGQTATMLLGASPASLAFGNVLDQSNSSLTTSITNNGNSNVTISGVTAAGAGFSASGIANGTVLTAGQSATLTVTFAPTSGGAVSGASVSIASNATNSPLNISLSGTGTHSVVLTWGASPTQGVTYNVFRGTSSGGEGTTPVNPSAITSLTYTDTGVTPGVNYYYYVEAVDSGGSSAPSNEAVADVPNP
jgi:hypothetical protein